MAFCNLCTKRAALHALFAALCKLPWELLIEEAELCEKQSPRLTAHYAHKEDCPHSLLPVAQPVGQSTTTQESRLLSLPRELRDMIYDEWLADLPSIIPNSPHWADIPGPLMISRFDHDLQPNTTFDRGLYDRQRGLLYVNHQIKNELLPRFKKAFPSKSIPGLQTFKAETCHAILLRTSFAGLEPPIGANQISEIRDSLRKAKHVWLCIDDDVGTAYYAGINQAAGEGWYEPALRSIAMTLDNFCFIDRFEVEFTRVAGPELPTVSFDKDKGNWQLDKECMCCKPAAGIWADEGYWLSNKPAPFPSYFEWEHEPKERIAKYGYIVGWRYVDLEGMEL